MKTMNQLIKKRDVYWVDAEDSIQSVVHYMNERRTGAVAVKANDEVVGVFSERDLVRLVANGSDIGSMKVKDVMSTDLITIKYNDEIRLAKAKMFKHGVRHLLVFSEDGVYHGLASIRDIIQAEVDEWQDLLHEMNDVYYEKAYKTKWWVAANRVVKEPYVPQ